MGDKPGSRRRTTTEAHCASWLPGHARSHRRCESPPSRGHPRRARPETRAPHPGSRTDRASPTRQARTRRPAARPAAAAAATGACGCAAGSVAGQRRHGQRARSGSRRAGPRPSRSRCRACPRTSTSRGRRHCAGGRRAVVARARVARSSAASSARSGARPRARCASATVPSSCGCTPSRGGQQRRWARVVGGLGGGREKGGRWTRDAEAGRRSCASKKSLSAPGSEFVTRHAANRDDPACFCMLPLPISTARRADSAALCAPGALF
jgi:hypothetical protein